MNTQPPTPGSPRDVRAQLVRAWLTHNTGAGTKKRYTYAGVAKSLHMSPAAVGKAVYDLRDHYPDDPLIVSTPCADNDWTIEVGWRSAAFYGLVSIEKQLATRQISEATVLERAADIETDPMLALVLKNQAAESKLSAKHRRDLAAMFKTIAKTREAAE